MALLKEVTVWNILGATSKCKRKGHCWSAFTNFHCINKVKEHVASDNIYADTKCAVFLETNGTDIVTKYTQFTVNSNTKLI